MGKKIYINLMINHFSKNNYEIIAMFYLQTDGDFDKNTVKISKRHVIFYFN